MNRLSPRLIRDAAMAVGNHLVDDGLPAHPRYWRFACGVHVGDNDAIGIIKGRAELLAQRLRPRVAMRLKHREHSFSPSRAGGLKGRADFRRVMRIIIDQKESLARVLDFKAATRMLKLTKGGGDSFNRNAELVRTGNHAKGVMHVVLAGHVKNRFAQFLPAMINREDG